MRYRITKKVLIFWCLFVSITAFYGGVCMLIDPSGKLLEMDKLLPYFEVLPFSKYLFKDYIFSGISLIIVNGLTNLLAVYYLYKDKLLGSILGMTFGITLMLWITIQFIIFPTNILSITYFIIGFIEFITGYMTYVFYKQNNFIFNLDDYNNIDSRSNTLVVFFSRMGYTKKIAYEIANQNKYAILELKTNEKTDGTLGFWWCGRFGILHKCMSINDINLNLLDYSKVIVVTPIWVFNISSPVREFLNKYKEDLNNIELITTHYMKCRFNNAVDTVNKITNKKITNYESIIVRMGKER